MPHPFHLCPDFEELHCHERLNYVLGQVLGVKDFQQEQTYFLHQNRLHNRSLHGYGTVWGLAVTDVNAGEDLEIQVAPGFALDTQGREVWVDTLQCAKLNTWLAATSTTDPEKSNWETLQPIAEESATVAVYVTLCYRPCPTGAQPILGNPCRADTGEEGVIQNTRIRDEFELQLRAVPPRQWEEDWVRSIADLLGRIDIDPGLDDLDGDAIATITQTLRDGLDDPARIPDVETQVLPQSQAENVLRDLLRYWVTHTRPALDHLHNPVLKLLEKIVVDNEITTIPTEGEISAQIQQFTDALNEYERSHQLTAIEALETVTVTGELGTRYRRAILQHWSRKPLATCQTTEDDCILLAAAQFRLTEEGSVDGTTSEDNPEAVTIADLQRPYLLHTRLIQELVLQAFIQNSVDELALGSGTARYSDPTGEDADNPGVFPAETIPSGVNVAFDVVVPNPVLYRGEARYATGDESSGVIPVEPLPDVELPDGTTAKANVAFNVIVPRPQHGLGEVRFSSGESDLPRVEESASAEPESADVAFDVILPELGEGRVFLEGSPEAVDADNTPLVSGVYPRSEGEGSERIAFDVVVPRSPGAPPTLGPGSVSVTGTPAAGGRAPGVYPSGTAANVAFDVVIPTGGRNSSAPTTVLHPMELMFFGNIDLPNQQGTVTSAQPGIINGYPALVFNASRRGAAFSTLRPAGVRRNTAPQLRLYFTARAGFLRWQVFWRWVESFSPTEGNPPQSSSDQLINTGFETRRTPENGENVQNFHLYRTPPLALEIENAENSDYLMVYLTPVWDPRGTGDNQLYLLMAELLWWEAV